MITHTSTWLARGFLTVLAICLLLTSVQAQTGIGKRPAPEDPVNFVRDIYRGHFANQQRWTYTIKHDRNKFAPELLDKLDALDRAQAATPDEVVGLDFNPITDSQENADRYQTGQKLREGENTIVPVDVWLGAEKRTIRFVLTPSGSSWKIVDLVYSEGLTLVRIITEPR